MQDRFSGHIKRQQPRAANDTAQEPSEFSLTFPRLVSAYLEVTYRKAGVILEYGSGGSTLLAARMGRTVFSVESDAAWAARLRGKLASEGLASAVICHVDIGKTVEWGRPENASGWRKFHHYPMVVWDQIGDLHPDVVLIDGRFRKACLAATAMRITRPVTVLFDDYTGRRRMYGAVEKLAKPVELIGRMARFELVPGAIPKELLTEVLGWFNNPN